MKKSSIVLACLLLSGACSKVTELDRRTESMEKATEKVSAVTDEMKNTATVMYLQIRSKESEDTRSEKFENLVDTKSGRGARIADAGIYFKAFEFQLWNDNDTYDNLEVREMFFEDAANEFTYRLLDIYEQINTKKMSPISDDKMEMSFYALAATVHKNHSYQTKNAGVKHTPIVSMYDLIKGALLKEKQKKTRAVHEDILINDINKEMMIELIKARVDMLTALGIKNLTEQRNMTFGQKVKGFLFKITGGKLGSIDLPEDYKDINDATKEYAGIYLDGAVEARNFLKQIGIKKQLEKTMESALKGIDFNEKKLTAEEKAKLGKDEDKENIRNLINQLLDTK